MVSSNNYNNTHLKQNQQILIKQNLEPQMNNKEFNSYQDLEITNHNGNANETTTTTTTTTTGVDTTWTYF